MAFHSKYPKAPMISTVVLIGIAAGGTVFVGTLVAVFLLLQHGGSFDRMKQEAVGLPDMLGEQKPLLYDHLLQKAEQLPLKPEPLTTPLRGVVVCIRNLTNEDAKALFSISNGQPRSGIYRELTYDADEMIWKYLAHGPFEQLNAFQAHYYNNERKDARHFVVTDSDSGLPIGMLTLAAHSPQHLRVRLDDLWLTPAFQGCARLSETILLLLTHLFDVGYRRVEWRCDGHNVRARRAAHSLGFVFEGVLRKHMIVKKCNRDTVMFAALNSQWPAMKEHLEGKFHREMAQQQTTKDDEKKMK